MAKTHIADIGLQVGNIPIRKLNDDTSLEIINDFFLQILQLLQRRAADFCDVPFITLSNICIGYSTYYLSAMVCLSIKIIQVKGFFL